MATEVTLPRLSPGMNEASVSRWLKKQGQSVTQREALFEVETEKVATEVTASASGTLSNLGTSGVDFFTPIINPPECAILGVGQITRKPVVRDDQIVIRPMMWLSLTFDHRVVDGYPAGVFLRRVQEILEKPYLLFV